MISQRLSPPSHTRILPRSSSISASLGLLSGWTQCQCCFCPPDRSVGGGQIGRCNWVPRCEEVVTLGPARKPKVSTGNLSHWTPASHDLDAAYESQNSVARIRATTYGSQTNVGEPGPPEPNPPEPEEPRPTQTSVCVSPHETQLPLDCRPPCLTSPHVFPVVACVDFCSPLLLLSPIPVASGKSGHLFVQLVLLLIPRTIGPLPVTTQYCCLIEPKRDCPILPILFNSTTHHQFHVATAIQWPSTIVLDASCTHAPASSPHSRPNTLVAPRCCPPVSPCLSSVAAARLAASLH